MTSVEMDERSRKAFLHPSFKNDWSSSSRQLPSAIIDGSSKRKPFKIINPPIDFLE
jgi:hypothetical protein